MGRRVTTVGPCTTPERGSIRAPDFDAGAWHVTPGRRAHEPQPDPVMAVAHLVDQQPRCTRAVADEHVGVAIVVHVAERRAASGLHQIEHSSRLCGYILELSTGVAEQLFALSKGKRVVLAA